jgi:hypothetical protein
MTTSRFLSRFPNRRISPFDGMTITADVWREAHDYHLSYQRLHSLSFHGSGIVTGLEVIASDPPGPSVYVLPGIAVDPNGNIIVVPEPVLYDFGRMQENLLCLLITYEESQPQPLNGKVGDQPFFIYTGFNLEAVAGPVDSPQVEIARVDLQRGAAVRNAVDGSQPKLNEIDLRFRRELGMRAQENVAMGVAYLSRMGNSHGRGLINVARSVSQSGQSRAWVDDGLALAQDLSQYTLIYLTARDRFQVDVAEVNALYRFVRNGGTLFIESCHREGGANPGADASFNDLLESLGVRVTVVGQEHLLLRDPHLFARPTVGFETQGAPSLRENGGVIISSYDYGCLWCGERRNGPAEREAIRSAMEWGENLLQFAVTRQRQHRLQQENRQPAERVGAL